MVLLPIQLKLPLVWMCPRLPGYALLSGDVVCASPVCHTALRRLSHLLPLVFYQPPVVWGLRGWKWRAGRRRAMSSRCFFLALLLSLSFSLPPQPPACLAVCLLVLRARCLSATFFHLAPLLALPSSSSLTAQTTMT